MTMSSATLRSDLSPADAPALEVDTAPLTPSSPERALRKRDEMMAELPEGYGPTLRLLSPALTTALTVAVVSLLWDGPATWAHAALVPVGLLFGAVVENALHRFALHHPRGKFLYDAHISHHFVFVPGAMRMRSYRELCTVLFPAWATLAVVILTVPLGALVALAIDFNAALVWAVTASSYVMLYETIHTAAHLPNADRGLLGWWARHHTKHHALEHMARKNFSVTLPVVDKIAGTQL
jgi:hypothetical protein